MEKQGEDERDEEEVEEEKSSGKREEKRLTLIINPGKRREYECFRI